MLSKKLEMIVPRKIGRNLNRKLCMMSILGQLMEALDMNNCYHTRLFPELNPVITLYVSKFSFLLARATKEKALSGISVS